ncbi:hypothetical protein Pst134EA_032420 [Puccinia striiformis f. sp. tritici]|uniref:uncharacterized protein n=1 Tax=Puccinia striiformis f. sp. tritici TaxID=168172 RepID=UPI002008D647|nr:uncharacterized protein Pst134EA_032420 [Puccinia striiformis f. sp. tritici]KAH9444268.1 hypothetical protein Pst134EA_032420 [Puccinia striiformis f. sp. tritici]
MPKKKSAGQASSGKKQEPIPENEQVEPICISTEKTSLDGSSPNTPNQRRKCPLPEGSQARSTPKRRTSSKTEIVVEPAPANDENIVPTPPTPENSQLSLDAEGKKEQGNLLFKAGKFTEAIASYSEAIRLNSDNPAYLANRAAALMSIRNYSSALVDMQLVISPKFIALGHQPTPKNIVRLVRCYLPLGQFYQAKQALKNLLEQSPSCIEAQKEDARVTKLESILNTLKRDRDRKDWSMLLIGLDRLQKELDCGPLKAKEWLIWKVEALCGQKKWDDAKCICNELVRSSPSDPEGLYYRAKVMYSQGELVCNRLQDGYPEVTSKQDRSTQATKSLVLTLDSNRAQALLKSELKAEATEVCNKILKIDKVHFKAIRTEPELKNLTLSELDAALADFEAALKIAPTPKDKTEIVNEIKNTKILIARGKYVDHYKVLGVSRDASDDELRKRFEDSHLYIILIKVEMRKFSIFFLI